MPNERTIEIQGQRIWTETLGSPSGIPILFISGAGAHAHFWTDTFCHPFVKQGYFLIRYDHRDVGFSHPSKEEYDLMRLAEDAIAILDAYNINGAHIVGHSMGGYIAQLLAAEFHTRILSITVISAGPVGATPALEKPHTEEEKEILNATWRAMLRNRPTQNFEESFEGYMGVWNRLNGLYPVDVALAKNYTEELFTRSRYPAGVHSKHVKVMQKMAMSLKKRDMIFEKIQTPTLIIHGEEDYLVPPDRGGKALAEALPHAQLLLIPEMGHMLFNYTLENLIADTIIAFILECGE